MSEETRESGDSSSLDALKPYLQMASGLVEVSAAKAAEFAQSLLSQGSAASVDVNERMSALADLGISPDDFRALVRDEVDRMVSRLGFVREDELATLRRHVDDLEQQLAEVRDRQEDSVHESRGPSASAKGTGAKGTGAKGTVGKSSSGKGSKKKSSGGES